MANVNFVFFIGNMTRDPVQREVPGGARVTEFGLAVNRKWKDEASGEDRESVMFIDVASWGASGDAVKRCCRKGSQVAVKGRLDLDTWNDDAGNKRSRHKVTADTFGVLFLSGCDAAGESTSAQGGRQDRGSSSPGAQRTREEYRQRGNGATEPPRQGTNAPSAGGWTPENDLGAKSGDADAMKPLRESFGEAEVFKEDEDDIPF